MIGAAFCDQEMRQGLDLRMHDGAKDAPPVAALFHQPGRDQLPDMVRQDGARYAHILAQLPDGKPGLPGAHKTAQDGQPMFGPERGERGRGAGQFGNGEASRFHISTIIELMN